MLQKLNLNEVRGGRESIVCVWKILTHTIHAMYGMYGIFTYIWLISMVNVGKYTIQVSYGLRISTLKSRKVRDPSFMFFFLSYWLEETVLTKWESEFPMNSLQGGPRHDHYKKTHFPYCFFRIARSVESNKKRNNCIKHTLH